MRLTARSDSCHGKIFRVDRGWLLHSLIFLGLLANLAASPEQPETTSAAPDPRFKAYGWIEGGYTFNADHPNDRQNFGRLFDYRSDDPLLNQVVVTLERSLPSGLAYLDWGFKLQVLVGSDARATHSLGLFDSTIMNRSSSTSPKSASRCTFRS